MTQCHRWTLRETQQEPLFCGQSRSGPWFTRISMTKIHHDSPTSRSHQGSPKNSRHLGIRTRGSFRRIPRRKTTRSRGSWWWSPSTDQIPSEVQHLPLLASTKLSYLQHQLVIPWMTWMHQSLLKINPSNINWSILRTKRQGLLEHVSVRICKDLMDKKRLPWNNWSQLHPV